MKPIGPIETVARAGGPGADVAPRAAAAVARMEEEKTYNPGAVRSWRQPQRRTWRRANCCDVT